MPDCLMAMGRPNLAALSIHGGTIKPGARGEQRLDALSVLECFGEYLAGKIDDQLSRRRAAWIAPALKATRGTLHKYIKTVKSAADGCVTDE